MTLALLSPAVTTNPRDDHTRKHGITTMDELLRERIRAADLLTIQAHCDGDGNVTLLGLPYATPAWRAATRDREDGATRVTVLVDPADMGRVLVRHPGTGALLAARATRAGYTRGLSLLDHLDRLRRVQPALAAELASLAREHPQEARELQTA